MKTYIVTAIREDGWWVLETEELDGAFTQVRRLGQADEFAREAIAMTFDVAEDSFDVVVVPALTRVAAELVGRVFSAREAQRRADNEARAAAVDAARGLQAQGLSLRDIGDLLDVTYQRAHQLVGPAQAGRPAPGRSGRVVKPKARKPVGVESRVVKVGSADGVIREEVIEIPTGHRVLGDILDPALRV